MPLLIRQYYKNAIIFPFICNHMKYESVIKSNELSFNLHTQTGTEVHSKSRNQIQTPFPFHVNNWCLEFSMTPLSTRRSEGASATQSECG